MYCTEFHKTIKNNEDYKTIRDIYRECEGEFVPPLSTRTGTRQKSFTYNQSDPDKADAYFQEMMSQCFVLCRVDETGIIAGFMSFVEKYRCDELLHIGEPDYITTICVAKAHRKKGLLKLMYLNILYNMPPEYMARPVATRTWTGNAAHLKTLAEFGFRQTAVIKNDRGNGTDTIYFAKDRHNRIEQED